MNDLTRAVEASLFASEEPMSIQALARYLGGFSVEGAPVSDASVNNGSENDGSESDVSLRDIRAAVLELAEFYAPRGVQLVERGGKWHFQTAPDLAYLLRKEREQLRRLSRAATEVLAIIAYHEPVSRAEVESIRGVQTAKGTLDVLLEAGWIRIAGRREVPGRPVIYATTPEFLVHFGLSTRQDLPGLDELRAAGLLDPVDDAYESLSGLGSLDEGADTPDEKGGSDG